MLKIKVTNDPILYQLGQEKFDRASLSFLQSYDYGQMQAQLGNEPVYLIIENEKEEIVSSVLAILFKAKRGKYLFLPYALLDEEKLKLVTGFLSSEFSKMKLDFLRISPLLTDIPEHQEWFKKLGFRDAPVHMMHPELLWLLDLNKSEKELLMDMRKNTRYALKQAEKMPIKILSGSDEQLLKKFYAIHLETSRRQHFVPYSWDYLKAQLDIFALRNEMKIYLAEYEDRIIAGAIVMFYAQEGVYHHGASLSEYNRIPGSYMIQWQAILEAKKRGLPRYNFWGVVENAPKHPWSGLSFFKQGFGGVGKALIHCQDKPLSAKYWLNFIVETLRRIKRGY